MATDKLINHSQGEDIISKLNSIATNIATVGNISLPSLGMGYTTCATAAATAAKTATLTGYTINDGGYVSVKFANAVGAGATLNINSQGAKAIYYQGAAITASVIKAGDIATFVYANNQYQLISLDNPYSDAQLAALNSTATKAKIDQIATNQNNILMLNSNGGGINDLEYDTLDTSHANGCTYTVNADKSITINRTEASANFSYAILKIDNTAIDIKALCDGNHYLIGTPEGGFSTSFRMYATGGNYLKTDYGNGILLVVPETTANINVIIRVESSYQADNLTFKPMIITKADYNAGYKGYQQYAPSNAELYAMIKALQT